MQADDDRGFIEKLFGSMKDALSLSNIFLTLLKFIIFGFITALPYLIKNLNDFGAGISGQPFYLKILGVLGALAHSTWTGLTIYGSTLWDFATNFGSYVDNFKIGTMLYIGFCFLFFVGSMFQPARVLTNVIDLKRGSKTESHWSVAAGITILFIFLFSFLSNVALEGATITSDLEDKDDLEQQLESQNENQTNSTELTNDEELAEAIQLL